MHQDIIEIPQVDIRQVSRQNALHLRIKFPTLLLIEFSSRLIDQLIYLRVGIVTAVSALRGESGGVESVFENIWVLVATNPAQRIELERSSRNISKESCEFECPYI